MNALGDGQNSIHLTSTPTTILFYDESIPLPETMRRQAGPALVILLLCIILAGCTTTSTNNDRPNFIGTWKTDYNPALYNSTYVVNHTYTFLSNGSASGFFASAWKLQDGKLLITYTSEALTTTSTYTYTVFQRQQDTHPDRRKTRTTNQLHQTVIPLPTGSSEPTRRHHPMPAQRPLLSNRIIMITSHGQWDGLSIMSTDQAVQ